MLEGSNDTEKLHNLCQMSYKEQCVFFLNAFWLDFGEKEADNIWNYCAKFVELDIEKKEEGCAVDEFNAHRFLESFDRTLSVRAMREKLYGVGVEKVKLVPITYYLIFHFDVDWSKLVNAAPGDAEEIAKAQAMLDAAKAALKEAQDADAAAKKAQAELEAAQAELQAQEDAYNAKTEELKRKSEEGGIVSRNRAKNELAQHLGEDPLPLRRAKLNTDAAVRKAEKAAAAAAEALAEAEARFAEAEAYLKEVSSKSGSSQGSIWWIDRELHEAKKYMPLSRGGIVRT